MFPGGGGAVFSNLREKIETPRDSGGVPNKYGVLFATEQIQVSISFRSGSQSTNKGRRFIRASSTHRF